MDDPWFQFFFFFKLSKQDSIKCNFQVGLNLEEYVPLFQSYLLKEFHQPRLDCLRDMSMINTIPNILNISFTLRFNSTREMFDVNNKSLWAIFGFGIFTYPTLNNIYFLVNK